MTRWVQRLLRCVPEPWRDDVARDLDEELSTKTSAAALQIVAIGLRLRAARAIDGLRARPIRIRARRSPMQDWGRDIRISIRAAFRRPGYSLAVMATLAIGIGANTAIYSIFNWMLFRPLPGAARPAELVTIRYQTPHRNGSYFVAYRDVADFSGSATSAFTHVAAALPMTMDLSAGGGAERIDAEVVTASYFALFGVTPVIGRDFLAAEDHPGSQPSVIISRNLWQRSFKRDPRVIGRTVTLNGRSFVVVGIAPSGFQGRSMVTRTDVWMAVGAYATLLSSGGARLTTDRRETLFGDSFGRLRQGVTVEQAQARAATAIAAVPDFARRSSGSTARAQIGPVLYPGVGLESFAQQRLRTIFGLLIGAVGLLLLLACANAANLLLARSVARRREIAVCQAIGASRFRVIRQQVSEALVLALAAGIGGLGLAVWLTSLFDGMRIIAFLPALRGIEIDWRVGIFTLVASVITGILFSTAPAVVSSRLDLQSALKDGATSSRGGRPLLRGALVTVQITISVVLVVAAGLLIRTLQNIRALELGIQPRTVVSASIQPGRFGRTDDQSADYIRELIDRLRHAPGIDSAAFAWTTSFSANRSELVFTRADAAGEPLDAASTAVSTRFFQTMGIPLLAGRDFTEEETRHERGANGVVIVSRSLATRLAGEGSALGKRLVLRYPKGKVVEVVGIVGDVRGRSVTATPEPWAYTPSVDPVWGTIQVRSSLPSAQVAATIRQIARKIDPVVAPHDVEGFGAAIDRALSEQRLLARLSAIFAGVAATLAAVGIFAMMAGTVAERRKEFGIRLALGAAGTSVLLMVLRSAVTIALLGVALGLGGAAGLRRLMESRVYGISTLDPLTLGAACLAILLLVVVASLIPGVRAARVDPVQSLRVD